MKLFRRIIFFTVLITAIAIFALSIFALTFDSNHYKTEIAQLASQQTGRDLAIDGELTLSIFPNISIKMGKASIGNANGFQTKNFATINAADISVKFLPLLQQKLEVNTITLHGLVLNLHRKYDGKTNWEDLASGSSKSANNSNFSEVIGKMITSLTVAGVSVKSSHIHWQDDVTGQKISLSPLSLKTGKYKADKPISINLSTQISQDIPAMKLKIDASTLLKINKKSQAFTLSSLKLETHLTGSMTKGGAINSSLTGDLSGNPQSVKMPNLKLNTQITGNIIPNGKITASISGNTQFNIKKQDLSISNMTLNSNVTGGPLQGGELNIHSTSNMQFYLAKQQLRLGQMKSKIELQGSALKGGNLIAKIDGDTHVDLQNSSLKIQQLNLNSTIQTPQIPGGQLKQTARGLVNLNWANNTGFADLSSLAINFADLQLTGAAKVNQLMASPEIIGTFKTNTFDLKSLLKTLGVTPPKTQKAGLLGSTQINFALDASPTKMELSQLAIRLDQSKITGNLAIQNFSNPAIQGKLNIDQLNVDNYMEADAENKPSTPGAAALLPLAAMRNMNVDTSLSISSLVYNRIKMNSASVHINAKNGIVNADPISANLYKGKYTGSIRLDTAKNTPRITMKHKLRSLRSEGILYDLFQDKLVTGAADLTASIHTSGNTVKAIKQNLSGSINLEFRDGTIRDSNFAKKTEIAVRAFEEKKSDGGNKNTVKFTKLAGDWNIKQGVFNTDNMAMKAPHFRVTGEGNVNIVKENLDFKLFLGRKKKKNRRDVLIPLRIYGPFTNLKYQLKLDELFKQLTKNKIDAEKQRAKDKLKKEEERLKKKLDDKKQAKIDELKKKRDGEKQKLQAKADKEKVRLKAEETRVKAKLDREKQRLKAQEKESKEKLQQELKQKVENKLKEKLKNLF